MIYLFECPDCQNRFELEQNMNDEHKATCLECGTECQRIYTSLQWIWTGSAYRPDGSLRQDSDYASLKG